MDTVIEVVQEMLKEREIRLFAVSVICYLSSFFFFLLPRGTFRALFHLSFGLVISFWCYGAQDALLCLGISLISYVVLLVSPTWIPVVLSIVVCEGTHVMIYLRNASWGYDCTAWTMVYMQKILSLAFNLRDGREIASGRPLPQPRWTSVAVSRIPPLTHFLAWLYTPIGSYSLPFIEYAPFAFTLESDAPGPGRRVQSLKCAFSSALNAAYVAIVMQRITWATTYGSAWFQALHPIVRSFLCPVFTAAWLNRYFAATRCCDAIAANTGLYDSGLVVESELSNHTIFWTLRCEKVTDWYQRWNHTTHIFWKTYLLKRLLDAKVPRAIANWSVYIASMVWHGIRPVYLSLLPEAVLIGAMDQIWESRMGTRFRPLRLLLIPYGNLYVNCAWFFPTWDGVIGIRKMIWFWPSVTWVIIGVVLQFVPKQKKAKE
jgi:hypothetical protein